MHTPSFLLLLCCLLFSPPCLAQGSGVDKEDNKTLRVFLFAGQSNMVGSHSDAKEVDDFPPFKGCGEKQPKIRYSYSIGRENMRESDGWTSLQPVNRVVGPELSFGKMVSASIKAPIAGKLPLNGTSL
jgi:hypothetical protein